MQLPFFCHHKNLFKISLGYCFSEIVYAKQVFTRIYKNSKTYLVKRSKEWETIIIKYIACPPPTPLGIRISNLLIPFKK